MVDDSIWIQPLVGGRWIPATEAANKILSSAQTREKCLKIFQCRILRVASCESILGYTEIDTKSIQKQQKKHVSWWSHESPRIQWIMTYHDASSRIQFFFPRYASRLVAYVLLRLNLKSDCDWPRLFALVTTAGGSLKDLGADLFQSPWEWLSFANQNSWDLP